VNEVYDVATDSWSTKTDLPFNERSLHAHVVDGKFFVAVPRDSFKADCGHVLYMYDPVKDLWTKKADMPQICLGSTYIVSSVVDDKLFFAGSFGVYPSSSEHKTVIYDTKSDTWSEGKSDSTQSWRQVWCGAAGVTTGVYAPKKFYTLGINSNNVYDPIQNTWSSAKAMPTQRANFGAAVVNDILYIIGGHTSADFQSLDNRLDAPSAINEQYIPLNYTGTLPPTTTPSTSESSITETDTQTSATPDTNINQQTPKTDADNISSNISTSYSVFGISFIIIVLIAIILTIAIVIPVVIILTK